LRAFLAFSVALISLFGATDSSTTNKKTSSKKTAYKKKSTIASTSTSTSAVTQKSKPAAPTTHAKSALVSKGLVAKGPVSKTPSVASTGAKKSTSKSRPVVASYRRSAQQQPTPERYREIQQALSDKGYFPGAPDGEWGASSVDALKRFQHDQNLTEDGKIGSVSLIALGLGPKRETPAPAPSPAPPDAPQPASIP
jgi:peptidoglycan hydrolase-like protein with peptidoglycan-binding domain